MRQSTSCSWFFYARQISFSESVDLALASICSQWHLERWHQYSMWLDHHDWIIRLAWAYTAGSVYHYSLDDPSRWCVKVRGAVTNAAVISPPSTLLANWPSKTLSAKHGRLGSAGARANTICLYPTQGSYYGTHNIWWRKHLESFTVVTHAISLIWDCMCIQLLFNLWINAKSYHSCDCKEKKYGKGPWRARMSPV